MNNTLLIILLAVAISLLILYVAFVAIYNHQELRRHNIQLQEAYQQNSAKELTVQEKALNDMIAQCAIIHKQIFNTSSNSKGKLYNTKEAYCKFFNLQSDKQFFKFVDTNLYDFASRLKSYYEELTIKEQKYIVFYLLKIDDADVAELLDYSITSLPTIKNRICKKVNVAHAVDLYDSMLQFLKNEG